MRARSILATTSRDGLKSRILANPGSTITICVANDPDTPQSFAQRNAFICGGHPGTFCNRLNYQGGRYVTVSGLSYKPSWRISRVTPSVPTWSGDGTFQVFQRASQQDLRNRLFLTFLATTLNGVTVDCPHRERLGYGEVTFATAWGCGWRMTMRALLLAARGELVRCPAGERLASARLARAADSFFALGRTLWSSAPLTAGWETYRTYGDKRLLDNAYPTYKKWKTDLFLNARVSNGILTQYIPDRGKFRDWAAPGGRKEWGDLKEASCSTTAFTRWT